MPKAPAVRA